MVVCAQPSLSTTVHQHRLLNPVASEAGQSFCLPYSLTLFVLLLSPTKLQRQREQKHESDMVSVHLSLASLLILRLLLLLSFLISPLWSEVQFIILPQTQWQGFMLLFYYACVYTAHTSQSNKANGTLDIVAPPLCLTAYSKLKMKVARDSEQL